MNKIKIVILNDDATIPSKTDSRCAGYDLCSNNNYFIKKGSRELISTGISVEILEYYLDFLLKSELGFVTDVPKYAFPSLELIWDSPYKITNLIVNLSNLNVNFDKFIPFQIQNLTIICDEKIEFNNKVFQCDPQSIYLVLNYSKNWRQIVKKYLCCFKNVSLVIINNSEIERDFITVHYVLKFTKKYSDKSIFSFEISKS